MTAVEHREKWIDRSSGYYRDILRQLNFFITQDSRVLEVGCSSGWLLGQLNAASYRVGVVRDSEMVNEATLKRASTGISFIHANFETAELNEKFDFIIISDVVPYAYDAQALFENALHHLNPGGRVFVSCYNPYLRPLYTIAEKLGLKRKSSPENWLTRGDIENLADLSGFEVIRSGCRGVIPWSLAGFGNLLNRWLSPLPIFSWTNLYYYALLRPMVSPGLPVESVSVIVPARNEEGNILNAVERMPRLAPSVELIFVEGNSTDDTWGAIQRVMERSKPDWLTITAHKQTGKGKANAVHKGFAAATGDVLMILDADLTVPPEDLPRFLKPIREGRADFVHGSRLVYPMEGKAMQFLNILGNKFFSMAFSFLLGQKFKDTLCGTKVFRRTEWPKILKLREYFGDFDPFGDFEMIFGAVKLNHKVAEIPVHYKARTYGETNISRFHHGLILLRMVMFAIPKMRFI